jgi:hypothetical protein
MYVEKADYKGRIETSLLNMIVAEDEGAILAAANDIASSTISTKAGVVYNIAAELLKVGAARNGYILGIAKSIATYEVYMRIDSESIPSKVIKRYEDDMDELEKVSKGKDVLDLPKKSEGDESVTPGDDTVGTTGHGLRRMGSLKKRTHTI